MQCVNKIVLCILFIISVNTISGQGNIILHGIVVNQISHKVIPNVNVYSKNNAIGIVTNTEGIFRIIIKPHSIVDTIIISCIAYESLTIPTNHLSGNDTIFLKPITYELDQVIIKPLEANEIINTALKNIQKNYNTEIINLHGFYRELLFENDLPIKLAESACIFEFQPYQNKFDKKEAKKIYNSYSKLIDNHFQFILGLWYDNVIIDPAEKVKIIEARTSEDLSTAYSEFSISGGPLGLLALDKVKYPVRIFDKKSLKKTKFTLAGITEYDNNRVFVLEFEPKKKSKQPSFSGKILISTIDFAFVSIQYNFDTNYTPKTYKVFRFDEISTTKPKSDLFKILSHKVTVNYMKGNYKWHISNIVSEQEFSYRYMEEDSTFILKTTRNLLINAVDRNNVVLIENDDSFSLKWGNLLYYYPVAYDENFWDTYNVLIPNNIEADLLAILEKEKKLEMQFGDKFTQDTALMPPQPKRIPFFRALYCDTITDYYQWLENISNDEVYSHIEEENNYTNNYFIPFQTDIRKITNELFLYRSDDTTSDIITNDSYKYYFRYEEGKDYEIICRKEANSNFKSEEILIDLNSIAKTYPYFALIDFSVSPDNKIIGLNIDLSGSMMSSYLFYSLTDNRILPDTLRNVVQLFWLNDSQTIYYTVADSTNSPTKLYKHNFLLKTDTFELAAKSGYLLVINKSSSKEYLFFNIYNSSNDYAWYFIDINKSEDKPEQIVTGVDPLRDKISYSFDHFRDKDFFITTNKDALNNRIMVTEFHNSLISNWKDFVSIPPDQMIISYHFSKDYLIVVLKEEQRKKLKIVDLRTMDSYYINFENEIFDINVINTSIKHNYLLVNYSNPILPHQQYQFNLDTRQKLLFKKKQLAGYDPNKYDVKRVFVSADDNARIPLTLVYRKDDYMKYANPVIIKTYGAYGSGQDCAFDSSILPLLNRGFVVAYAHVRGGDDLNNQWYEDGKLLKKQNSFTDFIKCCEHLIDKKYTTPAQLFAYGGSAGGLVMGAVANMRPELFKGVVFEYPFVDVLNTLLDTSQRLEYDEWGDPYEKQYYEYIKSYSPYTNIKQQDYPNMLFITGLQDTQVKYWESVKTVAKLRYNKTDNNCLLLKTYMKSGHHGGSGASSFEFETAFIYAFLLSLLP